MEAIRKKRIKNYNHKIEVDLPENFTAKEVDVIIWPSEEEGEKKMSDSELAAWRKSLIEEFSEFSVDLTNFKFNREELYDRP